MYIGQFDGIFATTGVTGLVVTELLTGIGESRLPSRIRIEDSAAKHHFQARPLASLAHPIALRNRTRSSERQLCPLFSQRSGCPHSSVSRRTWHTREATR